MCVYVCFAQSSATIRLDDFHPTNQRNFNIYLDWQCGGAGKNRAQTIVPSRRILRRRPEVAVKQQANGNEHDYDRARHRCRLRRSIDGCPVQCILFNSVIRFGWVFAANSCVGWGFPNSAKIMTRIPSLVVSTIFHFQSNCARLHDECVRWVG